MKSKIGFLALFSSVLMILIGCETPKTEQQQAAVEEEFPEELYVDTTKRLVRDTSTAPLRRIAPVIANREALEKSLHPNKDKVIKIDWNVLNDVVMNECFYEDIAEYYWCPEFGSIVRGLQGKTVALKGYVLPLEGDYFVLSMNPMASCFFCNGDTGPQTIVDLKFNSPRAFKMDEQRTFKGKLRLNKSNLSELFYILDDAEVYEK